MLLAFLAPSSKAGGAESYDSYQKFSSRLMNIMGSAKEHVWLRTTYLSDGNFVMGLNLALYRDVEVRVVLHSKRARYYMSRYQTLRKHKIPTIISKSNWPEPTSLVVDGRVYNINTSLDYKTTAKYFKIHEVSSDAAQKKVTSSFTGKNFPKYVPRSRAAIPSSAASLRSPIKSSPRSGGPKPLRGYKNRNKKNGTVTGNTNKDGVYIYNNKKGLAPPGVPTKLPPKTIWQLNRESDR